MTDNIKERYNNNKIFQKKIWDNKIFQELTDKQELILKIIYSLENVYKEDLANICFFLISDFNTALKDLRDQKYIYYKESKLGSVYALSRKSIINLEPYSLKHEKIDIKERELYKNKIKGAIVSKQLNDYIVNDLRTKFLNQKDTRIERYIFDQFLKNFMFKDFINKSENEKAEELNQINSLDNKELSQLLKTKNYNEKSLKLYLKGWIKESKLVQQDERYQLFRKRFQNSLSKIDDELRYYLKDFSRKVFEPSWKSVFMAFKKEEINYQNEYIKKQYIRHKVYKDFLKKQSGEQIFYLVDLNFKNEEIKKFFNLSENDNGRVEILYKKIKNIDSNDLSLFKDKLYDRLSKDKSIYHSQYLTDYKIEKASSIEGLIKNYLKNMDNNYLKDSNSRVLSSLNDILKELKHSNENVRKVNLLEKKHILFELFNSHKRNLIKQRNDYLSKMDNILVEEKNYELEEIEKSIKKLNNEIVELEGELSFRLLDKKEDDEQIEKAYTFRTLKRNGIYIDNILKENNYIIIRVNILDNSENGLHPYLIFKRIFILHNFLNQIIGPTFKLYINICTFNENRKKLLDNRMAFVKNRMKSFKREFGNIAIKTKNTTISNLRLWEFYNNVKEEIEKKGGQ